MHNVYFGWFLPTKLQIGLFSAARASDLVEILGRGPHLLPSLVEQLDADAEELLPGSLMGEEHGVVVVAAFIRCTGKKTGIILFNSPNYFKKLLLWGSNYYYYLIVVVSRAVSAEKCIIEFE